MKPVLSFLILPLALASLAFSAATPQQPSSQGWRQSQRTDSRGVYTRFTLPGKFLKLPQGDNSNGPALVVDCAANKRVNKVNAGSLVIGVPLKINYVEPSEIHGTSYYQKVAVRYRLDEAKEEKENWTPGTEKTSAQFSKAWLEKALRARTVQITANDDRGSEISMQFDMPDAAPMAQGCNVDVRKK